MKITVDLTVCQGYASCVIAAPEYFDLGPDGRADVLHATVPVDDHALVRDAVGACPVSALRLAES